MSDAYRSDDVLKGAERQLLEAFLHDNRLEIVGLFDGLTEEQARRRLVASKTTLLGLVKHATYVERSWFDVALGRRARDELGLPDDVDESFDLRDDETIDSVVAEYRRAWSDAEQIAAGFTLDDLALHRRLGELSLRWIYVHMIEELARHAGHGDILREQILNADGSHLPPNTG